MGLTIRPFVSGQDEATWVGIRNQARRDDEDFTPDTIEDVKRWEDAPWVGVRVRLMAEADCVPVARVSAETDKMRTDRKGFVTGPDVVSEYRHRGIGTALMQQALSSLRSAGLETAVVRTFDDPASRGFLESLGFSVVRRFCWMRRTLATVPSGVGEARDAEVVALGSTEEDLAMLCRLSNEAFEDHYDHTPGTVAEWKFATKKIDESGAVTYRTLARLAGEPAGFLLYGVDPKENDYLEKKRGDLRSIGVLKRFRGRGVAKRLMIDAMHHLRHEGMEEAELAVDETNVTSALTLYGRLGFAVARRRLVWNRRLSGFDVPMPPT